MENKKIGLIFAGQGAQFIGMGKEFYDKYDYIKAMYQEASLVLGYDLAEICFQENQLINQTQYTQPAILVTSLCIYEVLRREYNLVVSVTSGFSLGEYSALCASGVFDFQTIVKLIKQRAIAMEEAAQKSKGAMAAILGLDRNILEKLCQQVEFAKIANYNCPGQLVVSGLYDSVLNLVELAKTEGARRAVMLNVSGGFHTELMKSAAEKMYEIVNKTKYQKPSFDVIMNCNAQRLEIDNLPQLMKTQIESSVYFEDSIRKMIDFYQVDMFVEIGPGNVLGGFVKKIDATKSVVSINKSADLDNLGGI